MQTMDFQTARRKMIDQQIRPWDVNDERVLNIIERTPREDYVPNGYRALAYGDLNIPLGATSAMMQPKLEARLIQALQLKPTDKVLEIGSGSGYVTALLAGLAKNVVSVEVVPQLAEHARIKLAQHGIHNVTLDTGDGSRGWAKLAPYDAILVTGSTPLLPDEFKQQLTLGGRLVAIVGRVPIMEVRRYTRLDTNSWKEESLFDTAVAGLVNALEPPRFVF